MPKTGPFDQYAQRYEEWFEKYPLAYQSELKAIKELIPSEGTGIEIGVGTGRFAEPLGIEFGVEPSFEMREMALERGIDVFNGTAEDLPFEDATFDFALLVTTICFLDNIRTALHEINRVIRPGGYIIVGFIDKNSPLGKKYQEHKNESDFYKEATFYSAEEISTFLTEAGFTNLNYRQTLFHSPDELTTVDQVKEGYGQGGFVVVRGEK